MKFSVRRAGQCVEIDSGLILNYWTKENIVLKNCQWGAGVQTAINLTFISLKVAKVVSGD